VHPTNGNYPDRAETGRARAFKTYVEPELEVLFRGGPHAHRVLRRRRGPRARDAHPCLGALDSFDGQYPRSWLLTILRNTNINMSRRRRPDGAEDVGSLRGARPAFGATRAMSPERSVLGNILSEDLEAAVNSLPQRFRTVLLLVDVDRLTYAEAAEAIGTLVGTIMSRLSRARARVRDQLRSSAILSGRTP
jgi:RNA polymerase sigma-70 factor, ECF subfamily